MWLNDFHGICESSVILKNSILFQDLEAQIKSCDKENHDKRKIILNYRG